MQSTISTIFTATEILRTGEFGDTFKVEISETGQSAARSVRNKFPKHLIILVGFNVEKEFLPFNPNNY